MCINWMWFTTSHILFILTGFVVTNDRCKIYINKTLDVSEKNE